MDIKKYERLINLVINENVEQADELFHEIVVEKSREIFESIMAEEMEEDMLEAGQVTDMLDEINAEEEGVTEEDESDIEFDDEAEEAGDDLTHDLESDHDDLESIDSEDVEDAVLDIKDKLDSLLAAFEERMAGDEEGEEADFGDEEDMSDMDDMDDMEDMSDEEEEALAEAVQLQKVSVTHGDNGVQKKSPVAANSGKAGMDSKPVNFAGGTESAPTGPKGPSNAYSKGEKSVPGAGSFKNVPGKKSVDLDSAPKPKHGDDGVNKKSPVAESKKPARKVLR